MSEPDAVAADPNPAPRPGLVARARACWRGLGPAGPLLVIAGGGPLLGLLALVATAGSWLPLFEGGGAAAAAAFLALGGLLAACCMTPTHATSLVAGYVFGALWGCLLGFAVVLIAAALGRGLFARLVGARVLDAIAASDDARRVHRALLGRGFWRTVWLIALLRLSPLMPFAATNVLMASFGVRAGAFLCATAIGIAPRVIGVALVGAELSELDWGVDARAWPAVVSVAATVGVLWWIGVAAGRALRREVAAP
ncbi:MAG: VTT domain-containing protein [Planctomycetota bacterium]|nr:VTT domain-containing protein [Planctomycetota bacterium]